MSADGSPALFPCSTQECPSVIFPELEGEEKFASLTSDSFLSWAEDNAAQGLTVAWQGWECVCGSPGLSGGQDPSEGCQ